MAIGSGRVAAQTLEFGAWFDLIVGGAYSQGIQGITVDAEKAGTKFAETLNAGTQEMISRIRATESVTTDCLKKIVDLQVELKVYQKKKEEEKEEGKKEQKRITSGNIKEAASHTPGNWEGKGDKMTFREFSEGVKNWADALTEDGVAMIEAAEISQEEVTLKMVQDICKIDDEDEAQAFMKDFDTRLHRMLKHMLMAKQQIS
jgi:hypothetical protein